MQTKEMKIYNHIAAAYETALLADQKQEALNVCYTIKNYLKMLKPKTKMYGDGDKWMTATDLEGYNDSRIQRLEYELYYYGKR